MNRPTRTYGSVDPDAHRPVAPVKACRCDFSYLGTCAEDRQPAVEALLMEPARRLPHRRFLIAAAMYAPHLHFVENVRFVDPLPPPEHPAFYFSSRLTLNVTPARWPTWATARPGGCSKPPRAAPRSSATGGNAWINSTRPARRS